MNIELTGSGNIDRDCWNDLISNSNQGNVFNLSWFLDTIHPGWKAIIVKESNEILAVLPLFIKKKFGINYSLQPLHSKYSGLILKRSFEDLFAKDNDLLQKVMMDLFKAIPKSLWALEMNFSPYFLNPGSLLSNGFKIRMASTYLIDISRSYEEIFAGYKKSLRQRVSNFKESGYSFFEDESIDNLAGLLLLNAREKGLHISKEYLEVLAGLFNIAKKNDFARVITVTKNDQLAASVLFFYYLDTVYLFSGMIHPEYRNTAVKPYLLSVEIKERCMKYKNFDFLGSMIPGVAVFNQSFGSRQSDYIIASKVRFPLNFILKTV
jgi:hypothetical protein